MALLSSADAIAALTAAGWTAYKSPARANGRCQTLCYVVGGQPVNLGRLRQLAREVMAPAAAEPPAVVTAEPVAAEPTSRRDPWADPAAVVAHLCRKFSVATPETYAPAVARLQARGATVDPLTVLAELNRGAAEPTAPAAEPPATEPAVSAAPVAPEPTVPELSADAAAGRLSPRAVPAQPWDPGTPAARERVALQGERVAILWPIAQALRGAGVALPISWASDGPVMAGELTLQAALSRLPLGAIAQAAAALAALPPVTTTQDAALTLCDTGAVPGRPKL